MVPRLIVLSACCSVRFRSVPRLKLVLGLLNGTLVRSLAPFVVSVTQVILVASGPGFVRLIVLIDSVWCGSGKVTVYHTKLTGCVFAYIIIDVGSFLRV